MNENTDFKKIFVTAFVVVVILVVAFGTIAFLSSFRPKKGRDSSLQTNSNMGDMHKPSDSSKFNSLLGKSAPSFKLPSYDGREVSLSDYKGKNLVIFFSEGAMCYPSCWDQIRAFLEDKNFNKDDVSVLTVVVDSKGEWDDVIKKDPRLSRATVLMDFDRRVSADYGALTVESSMHRGKYPGHSYVLVNKEGIVVFEKDDPNMGINNKELLAYLFQKDK